MDFVKSVLNYVLIALLVLMGSMGVAAPFFWFIYMANVTGSVVYVGCSLAYVLIAVAIVVIILEWLHHGLRGER